MERPSPLVGPLSRRSFLRGAGTIVALPAFRSLRAMAGATPASPAAATTSTGAPLRTAFVYFPNGAIPDAWRSEREGNSWSLGRTLAALHPWKSKLQVLGGLDQRHAEPGPDGAGDHARGGAVFLTGVRVKKSASEICAGTSIDQALARGLQDLTRLPSLELTCDDVRSSGSCDSGYSCAYQFNMSWRDERTPMSPEPNARLAFERLFGAGPPSERRRSLERRLSQQKSVLDFVKDEADSLSGRLDPADRIKLDQYLTGVRELETRIQREEKFVGRGDLRDEAPGKPKDYAEHVDQMFDLLALAFQTDATRVGTLLLAHDGSNRPFDDIGVTEGHHDLTHHMGRAEWIQKVAEIDQWYVRRFARFLSRLEAIDDVDGRSLLDNSMIVYGSGNSDGNRHTHVDLPIVLAGGGGGTLSTGRYIQHGGVPLCNLFLSLADRMGVPLERFGDSTGRVTDV